MMHYNDLCIYNDIFGVFKTFYKLMDSDLISNLLN